jgi:hypothetical protein
VVNLIGATATLRPDRKSKPDHECVCLETRAQVSHRTTVTPITLITPSAPTGRVNLIISACAWRLEHSLATLVLLYIGAMTSRR